MVYRISGIAENEADTIAVTTINKFSLESSKMKIVFTDSSK
jgi:hypothetical protein